MTSAAFNRRLGLKFALAGGAAFTAIKAMPLRAASLDPQSPNAIYRKLRFRADEGLLFWWIKGRKYAQIGTKLDPLYDMQVGSLVRVKNTADGGYDATSLEIVFYTDIATGSFLRQWKNPYTGETLEIKHAPIGPTTTRHTPAGDPIRPTELGGSKLEASSVNYPAIIEGEDVWINHHSTAAVFPRDGKGEPFRVNDWSTYLAKASDVMDVNKPYVSSSVHLQEVTSWGRWMNMGDRPGNLTSQGVGRKVKTYAEMPQVWRKLVEDIDPDVAKDPLAVLDRPTANFER